jgi:flagellar hook-associated protein 3 FlgL
MSGVRVTERAIAGRALANLQNNISRLGVIQQQLSSGKLITRASDSPGGATEAMQYRSDIARMNQYSRNADDGLSWLNVTDGAISGVLDQVERAHELVLSGLSTGGSFGTPEARESIALEIDDIRGSTLGLANTTYLDRPVFGGSTGTGLAYATDGTYAGDHGQVLRTPSNNSTVRVDTDGDSVFGGTAGTLTLFQLLDKVGQDLRNNPQNLSGDLTALDDSSKLLRAGLSSVGARTNELTQMQSSASARNIDLTQNLSGVEDIDLPKTITDLALQQTAYQAALAATARVIQPSLVDFLK